MTDAPKVKLTSLREYTSRDGRAYLRGDLGDAKLLLVRDDRADVPEGCEAIWTVFLEQAPPRHQPDALRALQTGERPVPGMRSRPAKDTRQRPFGCYSAAAGRC